MNDNKEKPGKILVSACLLGENCKYNGGNNLSEAVIRYCEGCETVPVCPEVLGGLSVPRQPCEIANGVVRTASGESRDREFRLGAAKAAEIAEEKGVTLAILQSRSPSCGVNEIYDGSFTGRRIPGMGVFAELLLKKGIRILDAEDLER